MTKRQLIDQIVARNHSAHPGFLAQFEDYDLKDYLDHLCSVQQSCLIGNPHRYDKYFQTSSNVATMPVRTDQVQQDWTQPYEDIENDHDDEVESFCDPVDNRQQQTSFAKTEEEDSDSWLF